METNIKVEHNGKILEGILVSENDTYFTIKLESGYNANVKISQSKVLEREKKDLPKTFNSRVPKKNSNLPTIALLHTGGTIASKIDYTTGAVSSKITPDELLNLYPELLEFANLEPKLIANLSSEDMRFEHYNLLLEEIKNMAPKVDGIIISHGTDTMHYTSAALQYAIDNLSCPVLLVGAQRSSDRASSDAFFNLKAAIRFITEQKINEKQFRRVGICMHNSSSDDEAVILDGINAKKMHSSRRNAFTQINYKSVALVKDKISIIRNELFSVKSNEEIKINYYNPDLKIGFFKAHPHLFPEEIKALNLYDGVVIDGTGLGHIAVSKFDEYTNINEENLKEVEKLQKTTKVVVGVQTVSGQTNMNIYSSGRYLLKTGVLGQEMNLTTETLFIRLAYCLSQGENFENLWNSNLEGFEMKSYDL